MLKIFLRIAMALLVAVAFQMIAWAEKNAPIKTLPRPDSTADFQENVPINRLPGPVTTAIKNRFPKGELIMAERDLDNGKVKYEVKVRSKGRIYDVDVAPSGNILKIDRDVD